MRMNAIGAVLVVNVALVVALAFLWGDQERVRWQEPAALPPSLEEAVAMPAAEPADVSRYRETLERPLFAANRRVAPRADPGAEAQAADALKDVRLLGTYGSGERGGIVVLSGGKVQRVPVGDTIGGWKVAGGEGRGAALVRADGERHRLELSLNNVAPAAPAAAAKAAGQDPAVGSAPVAVPAAASETGRAEVEARPSATGAATARRAWGRSGTSGEEERRQRLDRINERRASRGLPPLQQSR